MIKRGTPDETAPENAQTKHRTDFTQISGAKRLIHVTSANYETATLGFSGLYTEEDVPVIPDYCGPVELPLVTRPCTLSDTDCPFHCGGTAKTSCFPGDLRHHVENKW